MGNRPTSSNLTSLFGNPRNLFNSPSLLLAANGVIIWNMMPIFMYINTGCHIDGCFFSRLIGTEIMGFKKSTYV